MIFKKNSTKYINDKELVSAIISGDKLALYHFYQTYNKKIFSYVFSKIENKKDAEELTQDTFLSALDSLRDFKFQSTLYTYLFSIAKYKVIDYYRLKKISYLVFSHFPHLKKLISKVLTPDDSLLKKELKNQIISTFKKIKPIYRKIIILKYQEDKSIKQISEILNISPKKAESLLFRARKKFSLVYEQNTNKTASKTKGDLISSS